MGDSLMWGSDLRKVVVGFHAMYIFGDLGGWAA